MGESERRTPASRLAVVVLARKGLLCCTASKPPLRNSASFSND